MTGTLDFSATGEEFSLSDLLEAQRAARLAGFEPDALAFSPEGRLHFYELLGAQVHYAVLPSHPAVDVKYAGLRVEVTA